MTRKGLAKIRLTSWLPALALERSAPDDDDPSLIGAADDDDPSLFVPPPRPSGAVDDDLMAAI